MIILIGGSGSGKSSVANWLSLHGYRKFIPYTTREPRRFEVDGIDYHFISVKKFNEMANQGMFFDVAEYNDWYYGMPNDVREDTVAVLTPKAMRAFRRDVRNKFIDVDARVYYLFVDRVSRLETLLKRGDNIEEAYRRNLMDVGMFDGIEHEVDFVVYNYDYRKTVEEIGEEILKNEEENLYCR